MKTCTKCGVEKDEGEFYRRKNGDLRGECKECARAKMQAYRKAHPEKIKEQKKADYEKYREARVKTIRRHYQENKERYQKQAKKYREENSTVLQQRHKKYREENRERLKKRRTKRDVENREALNKHRREYVERYPDRVKEQSKRYYEKNRESLAAKNKKYREARLADPELAAIDREKSRRTRRERYWKNPQTRLRSVLRGRVITALKSKGVAKSKKTTDLIGCGIEQLRAHLEAQFTEGMSWDKLGAHGIHIDHIRPCASFDLTDPEQQKICFHYTNLQPLWAKDNLSKGAKYEESTCAPLQNGVDSPDIDEDRTSQS